MRIKGIYAKRGWYYYQPPMLNGVRPPAIALGTKDQASAVDKAFELHTRGAVGRQSKESMEALLAEYLRSQRNARVHTAKTSDITRRTLGKLAKEWGNPLVTAIDRRKIEAWRVELQDRKGLAAAKMSDASVGSYLRRLSGFLSWLVAEKHIREHPMNGIKLGRVKKTKRQRFCTVEERERLLADPPTDEVEFILHFGFFAGLRFEEMLAMEKSWFSKKTDGWIVTVQETSVWKPKDKECRTIEVHPRLASFLERSGFREPFMLAPKKKEWKQAPNYRFNPKKSFKTYATSKGLPWVTYHTLRHTFATHLAMSGATLAEIADALGDSLRVTEENYVGLLPASRSRIAAI